MKTMIPRLSAILVGGSVATPAWAGFNTSFVFQPIPTLDEIGLGALIALVAGVAGWALKRRNRR